MFRTKEPKQSRIRIAKQHGEPWPRQQLAGRSTALVFFIAVLGFFLYAIRPVIQAWLLEVTPRNMGGSGIGVLFGAQSLGASVAPLPGGLIADRWGLSATFFFLAGTIVFANLFILAMPEEVGAEARWRLQNCLQNCLPNRLQNRLPNLFAESFSS